MGEVNRATDTNLKRQVAIKVLPQTVAADPERLARFHRQAEVLAALNHPNIAHIFGEVGRDQRAGDRTGRGADARGSDGERSNYPRRVATDRKADRRGPRSRS